MINKFFNKFLDFPYYLLTYNKKQRKVEKADIKNNINKDKEKYDTYEKK